MTQLINLNWNNRSVLPHQYSVLGEKLALSPTTNGSYGWEGGRPVDKIWVGFEVFKILYRLKYSGFYFVSYHSNVTTVIGLHFSRLLSSKAYFKVCC